MINKMLGSVVLSSILFSTTAMADFGDSTSTTGENLLDFPILFKIAHKDKVNSVKFSPNNKTLLTSSNDDTAKLWDLDGALLFSMNENSENVSQAIFNLDGTQLITRSYYDKENAIIIYDGLDGTKFNIISEKHSNGSYQIIDDMEFISNTNFLVVATDNERKIHIYDLINQTLTNTFTTSFYYNNQISITPDGKKVAIQYDKKIEIYYLANGELSTELSLSGDDRYGDENMQFIDNNRLITSDSSGGNIDIWNIKTGIKETTIRGLNITGSYDDIKYTKLLTDNLIIFNYNSGAHNAQELQISTIDGEYFGTIKNNLNEWVSAFDISNDKTKLAIAYDNGDVQVFDITSLTNAQVNISLKPEIKNLEVILKDDNTLNIKFQAIQN